MFGLDGPLLCSTSANTNATVSTRAAGILTVTSESYYYNETQTSTPDCYFISGWKKRSRRRTSGPRAFRSAPRVSSRRPTNEATWSGHAPKYCNKDEPYRVRKGRPARSQSGSLRCTSRSCLQEHELIGSEIAWTNDRYKTHRRSRGRSRPRSNCSQKDMVTLGQIERSYWYLLSCTFAHGLRPVTLRRAVRVEEVGEFLEVLLRHATAQCRLRTSGLTTILVKG